jgi:2-polyprenyl-6-methoxyphenol hydroxylase-like FAD-dependent oxidoreductase
MKNAAAIVPVLIVGAGPTGLVLALWLARRGISCRIIDKNAGPAPYSRALGVQARTLEFYHQLGIADRAVAGGVQAQSINFWVAGARAAQMQFGPPGHGLTPYPFVLDFAQDQHERLLIDELMRCGVPVERETTLLHFTQDEGGVDATLRHADGTEERLRASYIAGSDGAHSTVRETLGVGFPGGVYEHVFYVADVTASGPTIDGNVHIDLDRADFLAVFAMKGLGHARLVGTVRATQAAHADTLTFDDVSDQVIEHLRIRIEHVNWFSTYRVHHRVAEHFGSGRAFLLGDAAHIHSPVGAQGMNTGIGDAINLAWKLVDVISGASSPALLDSYEVERIAFARQLVASTDRLFTLATRQGPVARFARTTVVPVMVRLVFAFAPVRRYLFRTVSQLNVAYRQSRLSHGAAGRVRGGDRLPWYQDNGVDNFAMLTSRDWQVHVYGTSRSATRETCRSLTLALHEFPWSVAMHRSGFHRDAVYVVRPDGYVALAAPNGMLDRARLVRIMTSRDAPA